MTVELYALDCGSLSCPRKYVEGWAGDERVVEPCPSFVIRHPDGDVVYEGGFQPEAAVDARSYFHGLRDFAFQATPRQHVREQVRAAGIEPDAVAHVVVSHLHIDHTGAIGHFPAARYWVHESELAYARDPDWYARSGFQRHDFDRSGVGWSPLTLSERDAVFDLFGDGSVRVVFAPGHTAGLLSLVVAADGVGTVVLPSDAASSAAHWERRAFAGTFLDGPAYVRSVERLRALEHDAVVFSHDATQWATVPRGRALVAGDL